MLLRSTVSILLVCVSGEIIYTDESLTKMANFTASNTTQFHGAFEIAIIVWYTAIGICGFIGNTFVIAVTSSRSRLNSSHLMIIWLGCTDLINCLSLPLRYKIFYQAMTVSPSLCAVGSCVLIFLLFLNITSLGMVAIERYKVVQNINRNEHLSGKTVRILVVLCILTSAIFTIPFIWYVMSDDMYIGCGKLDSLDVNTYFTVVMVAAILLIVSTFILITVLYVKICILVRTRVGQHGQEPNLMQQSFNENALSGPLTEGKAENSVSEWPKELMDLFHQVKHDEGLHWPESDVISYQSPSQFPHNPVSSRSCIYIIGASPIPRPHQSRHESASSCEYHLPGPSSSSVHQIPGLVMDEHDNDRQISPPKMHSTIIQPAFEKDEPVIPVLNNQYQHNFMISRRVTCMLFTVTLVFFVTYLISSILALFFAYGLVRQFCREFRLINHIINPVIYSIASEGFRESCISFFRRIRERSVLLRNYLE